MKHLALIFDLLGTLVLIAACVTMAPEHSVTVAAQAGEQAKPAPLPTLKVDKGAPLLLDEPAPGTKKLTGPVADNEPCLCCHRNYEDEEMVHLHAAEKVGCRDCHGEAIAHRNDEAHVIPPEKMYPSDKIAGMCGKCHDSHDAAASKIIATWLKKCPAKTNPAELVCTDCHGDHRLKTRTSVWDKHTGKYLGNPQAPKAPVADEMK